MKIKPWAELQSSVPYDGVEEENDWVVYPGRNVAEAIQDVLGKLGASLEPIECLEHRGWEFGFKYGKVGLVCRATMIDDYLVGFADPSFIREMLKRTHPDFVALLRRLGDALDEDSRFSDIRWFAPDEVMTGVPGAARPVEATP